MIITVTRFQYLEHCTIGRLTLDGDSTTIYTLEDTVREIDNASVDSWKIENETAIPKGTYPVIINFSPHFNRNLPLLLNVPGFEGVRIHSGNTDKDTSGCILVGLEWNGGDFIGKSRESFEYIYQKIVDANSVEINIS